MSAHLQALTHGTPGLEFAYALVWAALLAGLIRARAPGSTLLLSSLLTVPVILLAAISLSPTKPPYRASRAYSGSVL